MDPAIVQRPFFASYHDFKLISILSGTSLLTSYDSGRAITYFQFTRAVHNREAIVEKIQTALF